MSERVLSNGQRITRYPSPAGKGHVYYADAGPEGKVPIWDSATMPEYYVLAALAWEKDIEPPGGIHPKPAFDKSGFRF